MTQKIAILGGGPGALSAAWELTELDKSGAYDITIYQMGWRLGGKCASSRNTAPGMLYRNEEHGLHVLGGWYHNTFFMLRRIYEAWEKTPRPDGMTLKEAFIPVTSASLMDHWWRKWHRLDVDFPVTPGEPGVDPVEVTPWTILERMMEWLKQLTHMHKSRYSRRSFLGGGSHKTMVQKVDDLLHHHKNRSDKLAGGRESHEDRMLGHAEEFLEHAKKLARKHHDLTDDTDGTEKTDDEARVSKFHFENGIEDGKILITLIVLIGVMIRGYIKDRLPLRGYDSINDIEATEWMRMHGAPKWATSSVVVEMGYHYGFSFIDGDPKRPNGAAGTTLRTFTRMFIVYQGAFFQHFNGGCGEILIKPFYDILRERGVKFRFFNQVMALEPSEDGSRIDGIKIRQQARVTAGDDAYEPLVAKEKLRFWPTEPDFGQIELAPGQTKFPDNFEDPADVEPGEKVLTLTRGDDFDMVVLGIPVTAIQEICAPLAAQKPKWQAALTKTGVCPTLAAQIWHKETINDLGWKGRHGIATGYVLPLSTWADMSFQLGMEIGDNPYKGISYLCGPYFADGGGAGTSHDDCTKWINDNIRGLLPNYTGNAEHLDPEQLYARANVVPSELYIFGRSGTINDRIRTDQSGYDNLFLTGDWIRNGTDLGWVEGAMMSGRQCARALSGVPVRVYGEADFG